MILQAACATLTKEISKPPVSQLAVNDINCTTANFDFQANETEKRRNLNTIENLRLSSIKL